MECILDHRAFIFLSVYVSEVKRDTLFSKLEELLSRIMNENYGVFLCGDFNIDLKANDSLARDFVSLLSSYDLHQKITDYTRVTDTSKSCLDNVFTNIDIISASVRQFHVSDHLAQIVHFPIAPVGAKRATKVIRQFNVADKEMFRRRLEEQSWLDVYSCGLREVNRQWNFFMDAFIPMFNGSFPVRRVHVGGKSCGFYCDGDIVECKRLLDALYVLQTHDAGYKPGYVQVKKRYDNLLIGARRRQYNLKLHSSENKSKTVWQIVNGIKGKDGGTQDCQIPGEPNKVANDINQFLIDIPETLMNRLPKKSYVSNIVTNCKSIFVQQATETEILDVIRNLKSKSSSGFDDIPISIVKFCARELCQILTYIVNNSLMFGIFPDRLKVAIVKPLLKRGDPKIIDNYRPISILTSFSKIFESVMTNRIVSFFSAGHLFSASQHGYITGKSINTGVYEFIQAVILGLENKEHPLGIFLDISKAYDCLDHRILIDKLQRYGIRGAALQWVASYLTDRAQKVVVHKNNADHFSDISYFNVGIPQGSIIGPILFVIYINELPTTIKLPNSSMVNYADDTTLLIKNAAYPGLLAGASELLSGVEGWFLTNRLIVNEAKNKCILFKTNHSRHVTPSDVNLGNKIIPLSEHTKFLGIVIDDTLSWSAHVKNLASKLNSVLYTLRVMRKYLDEDTLMVIYYANFQSLLKFGLIFWGQAVDISIIFIIQKSALRVIHGLCYRDSCRGLFRRRGILTLSALYIFEILMFYFKNSRYFLIARQNHDYPTRGADLIYPSHRLTVTEKSCFYSGIKFYNNLPKEIKCLTIFKSFKTQVYTFLVHLEPYNLAEYFNR